MKYRTRLNEIQTKLGKNDMVWVFRGKTVLAVSWAIKEGCTQKAGSEGREEFPGAGNPEVAFPTDEL